MFPFQNRQLRAQGEGEASGTVALVLQTGHPRVQHRANECHQPAGRPLRRLAPRCRGQSDTPRRRKPWHPGDIHVRSRWRKLASEPLCRVLRGRLALFGQPFAQRWGGVWVTRAATDANNGCTLIGVPIAAVVAINSLRYYSIQQFFTFLPNADCKFYTLDSINVVRKYLSILDLLCTCFMSTHW